MNDLIEQVVKSVEEAQRILFITGAGISAESGLPTYRGVSGLYESKSTDEGMQIEEALSGEMFQMNPEITWKYVSQIEAACRDKKPNSGHYLISKLESLGKNIWVLTQNIDGFHHQAGSSNVIDIHGHIYDLKCPSCHYRDKVDSYDSLEIPPKCPECGTIIRPDVVLFNEMLPMDKLTILSDQLNKGFDLIFSIGTTSVFQYIAQPVLDAVSKGVPTVEINPTETTVSRFVKYRIADTAVTTLESIWEKLNG